MNYLKFEEITAINNISSNRHNLLISKSLQENIKSILKLEEYKSNFDLYLKIISLLGKRKTKDLTLINALFLHIKNDPESLNDSYILLNPTEKIKKILKNNNCKYIAISNEKKSKIINNSPEYVDLVKNITENNIYKVKKDKNINKNFNFFINILNSNNNFKFLIEKFDSNNIFFITGLSLLINNDINDIITKKEIKKILKNNLKYFIPKLLNQDKAKFINVNNEDISLNLKNDSNNSKNNVNKSKQDKLSNLHNWFIKKDINNNDNFVNKYEDLKKIKKSKSVSSYIYNFPKINFKNKFKKINN